MKANNDNNVVDITKRILTPEETRNVTLNLEAIKRQQDIYDNISLEERVIYFFIVLAFLIINSIFHFI